MLDFLYPPLEWRDWRDDWPLSRYSQFANSSGLRWHYQKLGQGPVILLLHGTGASTHTWRDLVPIWASAFTVISVDLPGHAFTPTQDARHLSLPGMAIAVMQLMADLQLQPQVIVGHSAGAAVAAQMVLTAPPENRPLLVALNPAWLPMPGMAGWLFAPAAKLITLNPTSAWLMAKQAARGSLVARVMRGTGSQLTPEGLGYYKRLFSAPAHVRGVLAMMVGWDLAAWHAQLEKLNSPVLILCGDKDQTVDPESTLPLAQRLPQAEHAMLPALGHLAHEEAPREVAQRVTDWVLRAREGTARSAESPHGSASPPH